MPELPSVEGIGRAVASVVPEEGPAGDDLLIGTEERIELPRQPALGHGEGEPAGLGPVGVIAGRRVELVVLMVGVHLLMVGVHLLMVRVHLLMVLVHPRPPPCDDGMPAWPALKVLDRKPARSTGTVEASLAGGAPGATRGPVRGRHPEPVPVGQGPSLVAPARNGAIQHAGRFL